MVQFTKSWRIAGWIQHILFIYDFAYHCNSTMLMHSSQSIASYTESSHVSMQVPGLFQRDSIDELLRELVPAMEIECPQKGTSLDNLIEFFESRIVNNLHVVLCFSPVRFILEFFRCTSVACNKFECTLCTDDQFNCCVRKEFMNIIGV